MGTEMSSSFFYERKIKMTRKHFIALAKVCIDNRLDDASVQDIAQVCKSFNKNFSMIKFFNYIKFSQDSKNVK